MRTSLLWSANVALILFQLVFWVWSVPVPRALNSTDPTPFDNDPTPLLTTTTMPTVAVVAPNAGSADTSLHHEVNHNLAIEQQNRILNAGQQISLGITKTLLRPFTLVNNGISAAASALPGIMAAQGAAFGAVIAAPIQFGALTANTLASGFTGALVSVPVSIITGGRAQLAGLAETGRQLLHTDIPQRLLDQGQVIMKPVALVAGSNSILAGMGVGLLSSGVKNVGQGVERVGLHLTHHGNNVQNAGQRLMGWFYGRPFYLESNTTSPIDNSTITELTPLSNETLVIVPIEQEIVNTDGQDGTVVVTDEPQLYELVTDGPLQLFTSEPEIHQVLTTESPVTETEVTTEEPATEESATEESVTEEVVPVTTQAPAPVVNTESITEELQVGLEMSTDAPKTTTESLQSVTDASLPEGWAIIPDRLVSGPQPVSEVPAPVSSSDVNGELEKSLRRSFE